MSNNCGTAGVGNSLLLENRQIRRLIASYLGRNTELERQYLADEVEIELNSKGTRRITSCRVRWPDPNSALSKQSQDFGNRESWSRIVKHS
ncbi:CoA transferase [Mycobacterium sp. THU-M104]|uniref:CoA transferase n=1 Tax=Mycobacterium sp. THU-M104 TaxID=3410515 RepID=UPI003B9D8DD9